MPNWLSDQYTIETAVPQQFNKSYDMGGEIKKHFSFTVPVGTAAADTVQLASVPKGAILMGGKMTTDGAGNNVTLGDPITGASAYLGVTSMAASDIFFGNTIALNYGLQLAQAIVLTATITTGAWTAGKVLKGYIAYRQGS